MWETPPASAGDKLMAEPSPNLGGGSFCRESVRQSAHSLPGCRCLARASPSSSAVAQATLDLIESAADRVAILKGLFGAEVGKVPVSTRRVTELSAEIRQHEANIQKWIAVLDPYMSRQPKSKQHQSAAFSRWHGGAA